ncbi:pollen-specific leucine-rich repeat extensin-like protein 3 [Iris pallida]|uniref:Pollen-specific leucine-rich repeat extensin-like protein 3 n=1 Tax=Iris pallida TaxID=29817 RepID=A0AAX6F0T5_IRIPA|nr:pollen-specific leucine-rich repeat extensin-like protein 3 [Iris pallida]
MVGCGCMAGVGVLNVWPGSGSKLSGITGVQGGWYDLARRWTDLECICNLIIVEIVDTDTVHNTCGELFVEE